MEGDLLVAEVVDTGRGFDTTAPQEGNGLHNLATRFEELGGSCVIGSVPGKGTRAVFRCQLPKLAALPRA
jgi:signal transduction histidine kinase